MKRAVPLTIAAGALACVLAAGSAQAAPAAASGILGKLATTAHASTQVEQAGWRHRRWRHRHWRHRHWHRRCVRRCMWRSGRSYRHCRRVCRRRWRW